MTTQSRHSLIVGWAKIFLPLMALALLSTLFLFARGTGDTGDVPFAEIDALAREQNITAPAFSGVTEDGLIVTLTASSAKPDDLELQNLSVINPKLQVSAPGEITLLVSAGSGQLSNTNQTAELSGLARLETSDGYLMETTGLIANLSSGEIESLGPLEIRAPFGQITAGKVFFELGENGQGQQMRFTDGVRLLYIPQIQ